MSKKKRRKLSNEVKEEAVKLITEQGCSIAEAAGNFGINANQLGRWKKEIDNPPQGSGEVGSVALMQAALKHLRKENNQLKMEREILKKAATSFAKDQGEGITSSIQRRRFFQCRCCVG